jgi:FkbM family methyltransferase
VEELLQVRALTSDEDGFSSVRAKIRTAVRRLTFPLPEDQLKQGFEPNIYIRFLRLVAKLLILLFRLDGTNRFSNEFIQALDPKMTVTLSGEQSFVFRTGHGRLLWRALTFQREEPMLIDWIDQFDTTDCFYDVGANVGSYSVYAAKRGIRTLAFEPEPNNLQLLCENIFLNQLQTVCTPLQLGLGESTRLDVLFLKSFSKGDALHSVGRKSYLLSDPSSTALTMGILAVRLDDVINIFDLPRPTRIKIDVDGNELSVIRGAMKTLDYVRGVYVEADLKQAEHREVIAILKEKGFDLVRTESIRKQWNPDITNYLFSRGRMALSATNVT